MNQLLLVQPLQQRRLAEKIKLTLAEHSNSLDESIGRALDMQMEEEDMPQTNQGLEIPNESFSKQKKILQRDTSDSSEDEGAPPMVLPGQSKDSSISHETRVLVCLPLKKSAMMSWESSLEVSSGS
jgi:hypothetical protein